MKGQSNSSERRLLPGICILKHYDEIKTIFETDTRDHPAFFDECLLNAISIYLNQNLKSALMAFDQAVLRHPEKAEAYYYRSLIKYAMTDYPGTVLDCSQAISMTDIYECAILRRAIAKYQCGLFTKALDDLDWTIELDPTCGQAWYVRGIIKLLMRGDEKPTYDLLQAKKLGCRHGCELYLGKWMMIIWTFDQTSLIWEIIELLELELN